MAEWAASLLLAGQAVGAPLGKAVGRAPYVASVEPVSRLPVSLTSGSWLLPADGSKSELGRRRQRQTLNSGYTFK